MDAFLDPIFRILRDHGKDRGRVKRMLVQEQVYESIVASIAMRTVVGTPKGLRPTLVKSRFAKAQTKSIDGLE